MSNSIRNRSAIAIATVGSLVAFIVPSPASASVLEPFAAGPQTTRSADSSSVVLRRDPSQATAFVTHPGSTATSAGDAFDLGDAAIGAGAGLLAAALVVAGWSGIRRHEPASAGHGPATAQSA